MFHDFNYPAILAASSRASWEIEDVIPAGARLDFGLPFMPEALARTAGLDGLSADEKRLLNQIRGHDYLCIFGLVEEFILPFVLDHARPQLNGDDERVRALLNFASEEAKHIHLFKRFHAAFTADFGHDCKVIGPPEAVAAEVLRHDPLSIALVILMIEWMTQSHYVDSVKDDRELDPLFKSLLKHHWMEEAQHAKLDTLMVEALAEGRSAQELALAVDGFFAIGLYLDAGIRTQAELNLAAFERAAGRTLSAEQREALVDQQHQALRWTYLGSGLVHPKFRATLGAISPEGLARIDEAAPAFA
ncbi:MAG TPA: diiron oxygenase [Allosphingosinicella sp.]|nr:diiron oxygenase [Allosphingosinicella sp.]